MLVRHCAAEHPNADICGAPQMMSFGVHCRGTSCAGTDRYVGLRCPVAPVRDAVYTQRPATPVSRNHFNRTVATTEAPLS